jgi:hypothetical protein
LTTFGVNIGQDDPIIDVQERTKMTSFGDFERLFASVTDVPVTPEPDASPITTLSLFILALIFM